MHSIEVSCKRAIVINGQNYLTVFFVQSAFPCNCNSPKSTKRQRPSQYSLPTGYGSSSYTIHFIGNIDLRTC
ncbi:hypothetical protein BD408DRAFT_415732 [Parasitella parasitica]|nr:hypothetical protein BD408DRAFT_415732 [Parasitella parasitica]